MGQPGDLCACPESFWTYIVRYGEVEDFLEGVDRVAAADRVLLGVADVVVGRKQDLFGSF